MALLRSLCVALRVYCEEHLGSQRPAGLQKCPRRGNRMSCAMWRWQLASLLASACSQLAPTCVITSVLLPSRSVLQELGCRQAARCVC
jgi:hypothetical protein